MNLRRLGTAAAALAAFTLAAQAQDLNVDASVENFIVVHAAGAEQMLPAQHSLRRLQKCRQECKSSLGQGHDLP